MDKPEPRECAWCGKTKGTTAFRYYRAGQQYRDYFHPNCFDVFLTELDNCNKAFLANLTPERMEKQS